jgi:cyclase
MFRPRIIPVLLLHNGHLVKSKKFKNFKYIGDPLNAVKIFNEFGADELVILDISATRSGKSISIDLVREIGEEANMPFCVGGGISSLSQIRNIISSGAEKVVISSHAVGNPDFVMQAANEFGSSTITVCIDIKKTFFGKDLVFSNHGSKSSKYCSIEFAQLMESKGAGEIIVQSIDRDGLMVGYDLLLLKKITEIVSIPVVALGGAGSLSDLKDAYAKANVTGLAAGSMFVYYGSNKGVLVNYPSKNELKFNAFYDEESI